ncbi:MAG: hypothetical protein AYL33_004780 [Candidatus Bathyarchaeota archaeon B63]|nr:MAG: hypothetical protein AYL33_004780 [Candidatus Bathyarchaeota archaeon B63]
MHRKDLREFYKEAVREWRENYKKALGEWKERFRKWKDQAKDEISKGSLPPLPPMPSVPPIPQLTLPGVRSNVVASRISDEDLKLIDMLIEAGLFKTRSEAVAYLVNEGIKARQDIIEKVSSALEEIRRIRRQAEKKVEKLRVELGLVKTGSGEAEWTCPQCRRDLSNLPDDIKVCPYCGAGLSK